MEIRKKRFEEIIFVMKSQNDNYINKNQLISKSHDLIFQAVEYFPEFMLEVWKDGELYFQIPADDVPCTTVEDFFKWVNEQLKEDNSEDLTMKKIVNIKNGWYKKVLDDRNMSL